LSLAGKEKGTKYRSHILFSPRKRSYSINIRQVHPWLS